MIRAVLDVNVIVSGFPAPTGVPATLVRLGLAGYFELVLSEHIMLGVERAWRKPYFRARYSEIDARIALDHLRRRAIFVEPSPFVRGVAEDEEDDRVLGTAVSGNVEYLVTGDNGLLKLHAYRGIAIIAPRDFSLILERLLY